MTLRKQVLVYQGSFFFQLVYVRQIQANNHFKVPVYYAWSLDQLIFLRQIPSLLPLQESNGLVHSKCL